METFPYQRVDLKKLDPLSEEQLSGEPVVPPARVRWWILPLAILLCGLQAVGTILGDNIFGVYATLTLIPVICFAVLLLLVLALNPLLALLGGRKGCGHRLNRIELICLFASMLVTSSFSSLGLAANLVPMIPAPWNPELNTPQSKWGEALTNPEAPVLHPRMYIQEESVIRLFREGVALQAPAEGAAFGEVAAYYLEVFRMIPWGAWLGPLCWWMVFAFACFGLFYSLSWVLLRFWSDREKLIFPLAQLPAAVLPSDSDRRLFPEIFYRPVFWVGFAISLLVLSWNGAIAAGWVVAEFRINLGMSANVFTQIIEGSWIAGLGGSGPQSIRFLFIFTAIGIAFLLPTHVSFSTWFYFLVGQLMVLIAVWIGVGQNFSDFTSDFISTANFLTAQGGGALLALAAICLYRALWDYWALARSQPAKERLSLLMPVIWLAVFSVILVSWLLWNGVSLFWATVFVGFITLLSVGFMRVVAETGIYYFQANFGFFHAFNVFGIGKVASGALVAPLLPIYSIFFMDMKAFAAPNFLNAAKLQKDNGKGRRMFHTTIIVCVVLTAIFSLALIIFLSHLRGAQQMSQWYFSRAPIGTLNAAKGFVLDTAQAFSMNGAWVMIGAAWLCLSLWLRKSLFWFPHPIGFILLLNPLLASIWFSFLIGWIFKKITVKYGGKSTFDLLRPAFIGLIFGELAAIALWLVLGMALGFPPGIDLNRTGP